MGESNKGCDFSRCYLVDDSSMLTFDPQFVTTRERDRHLYEGVSLAHRDGFIFSELVRKGLFIKHSRINYQGVCSVTPQVPQVRTQPVRTLRNTNEPKTFNPRRVERKERFQL